MTSMVRYEKRRERCDVNGLETSSKDLVWEREGERTKTVRGAIFRYKTRTSFQHSGSLRSRTASPKFQHSLIRLIVWNEHTNGEHDGCSDIGQTRFELFLGVDTEPFHFTLTFYECPGTSVPLLTVIPLLLGLSLNPKLVPKRFECLSAVSDNG